RLVQALERGVILDVVLHRDARSDPESARGIVLPHDVEVDAFPEWGDEDTSRVHDAGRVVGALRIALPDLPTFERLLEVCRGICADLLDLGPLDGAAFFLSPQPTSEQSTSVVMRCFMSIG
ncbi:MAG TPA: hypothetical protein VM513_20400, partial [Kofleriaceae bacterium]|nr:hypothetical protein [Kofleriaceae bacterium]